LPARRAAEGSLRTRTGAAVGDNPPNRASGKEILDLLAEETLVPQPHGRRKP
jgi:hypothetical protein